jgi:hypothetical protein
MGMAEAANMQFADFYIAQCCHSFVPSPVSIKRLTHGIQ